MSKRYMRMLIAWLSLIIKKATFRSQDTFLAILRLFRRCEVIDGGKERILRENGLALSTQPSNQEISSAFVAVTLAVPLQSGGSQPVSDAQHPYAMPEPSGIPPPSAEPEQYFDITLTPIVPAQIKRYDRKIPIPDNFRLFGIKKGLLNYSEELPSEWQALTHPEGALFFYHPDKRVFTDADVRKLEDATKVSRVAEKAYQAARDAEVTLPPLVELGLEFTTKVGGSETWGYYFVDCDSRVVFWFEDNKSRCLMNNVRGVEHTSHVGYAIESQYWQHIELFPNKRFLPKDDVVRLKEVVMHTMAENITSDTCLAPFNPDEIGNMLTLMDPLSSSINEEHEHSVCIVARFMRLFYEAKFVNFCGQTGARLDADKPLYGDPSTGPKPKIFRFMNIVLFGSPDAHSKGIHRVWVDKIILQPRWKNFIDRLNGEWNGYTIFSTVMLAVDISFLAVPTVQTQIAATIAAYLSTICAMGSLMISVVLAGQVNDTRRNNAEGVASFMSEMSKSVLGLESLAIMLSLPFALLIWGMICFGIALSILIFRTSSNVTISVVAPILSAVVLLATWPVIAINGVHPTTWRTRLIERLMREHQGEALPMAYQG